MLAPALPDLAKHYNITSETIIAMVLSIFLLTFAIGPLFLAPLSEIYGRAWVSGSAHLSRINGSAYWCFAQVLHINNVLFTVFNLVCAFAPSTGVLIGMRILCAYSSCRVHLSMLIYDLGGFFGSAPIACGGGSISDLFSEKERASAMAVYSLGPLIGPAIGPIAGGFIAQTIGFKYIFIVISATSALASAVGIPFLRETYAPVILSRRAARLQKETGAHYVSVFEKKQGRVTPTRAFKTALSRPWALLILIGLLIVAFFTSYVLQSKKIQAVHETVISIFAGMVIGLILRLTAVTSVLDSVKFNYQFFFNLLLPPIILASGYELHQVG